jgi:HAMP domain-containing protein
VLGVAGTWKDLTDSVNSMANNLTAQVRNIAEVATAIAGGDLSKKITVDVSGEILQLKNTLNTMVDQLNAFAGEVTRVAREVGTEGKLGGQAQVPGVAGTWKDLTDNGQPAGREPRHPGPQHRRGHHRRRRRRPVRKITVDAEGRDPRAEEHINTMVDQLNAFAGEVTRVARESAPEAAWGGRPRCSACRHVEGPDGLVNSMANNLTAQVRNIAEGGHRHRRRRPVQEDHRRRQRRDPAAEADAEHDGGSAERVRRRSDARRA